MHMTLWIDGHQVARWEGDRAELDALRRRAPLAAARHPGWRVHEYARAGEHAVVFWWILQDEPDPLKWAHVTIRIPGKERDIDISWDPLAAPPAGVKIAPMTLGNKETDK